MHPEQGDPVDVVELDGGAHDLEQPRQHAHLHPQRLELPDRVQEVIGDNRARRDDRPLDLLRLEQGLQRAGVPEHGHAVRAGRLGLERHPADHARLQARRLVEPAPDPASGLGVAHHEAPLLGRHRTGVAPGERPSSDHAREQQRPDADRLVTTEVTIDDQVPRQPDQERV